MSFKPFCGIDDSLDVFAVHGVGAIVGNMLTGVFAQQEYGAPEGGGLDGNWELVVRQVRECRLKNTTMTIVKIIAGSPTG